MKAIFMIEDTRTKIELDNNGGVGEGEIFIFDSKGITTKHLMKIDMSTIRVVLKYIQVTFIHIKKILVLIK